MIHRRAIVVTVLGLMLLCVTGCQTGGSSSPLQAANQAYQNGNYRDAYNQAMQVMVVDRGEGGLEARYIAGLSAQRLKQDYQAQELLSQASQSTNKSLSGNALAALGLLQAEHLQYDQAQASLVRAGDKLQGEDRANALFHAAVNQQKLGWWPQARNNLLLARDASRDKALLQKVNAYLSITGFTLQLGAYTQSDRAMQYAKEVAQSTAALNLGSPRVVPPTAGETPAYFRVHIGRFTSHPSALAAKSAYNLHNAIVAPLAGQK
ncbi:MAG: hypothetical protein IT440_10585 [Phycisphaeraceae bacterium]|nr:hypothetical protein [Phycisphaeraceae bacterium]